MTLKGRVRTGILSQARGQVAGVCMAAVMELGMEPDILRPQNGGTETEAHVLLEL